MGREKLKSIPQRFLECDMRLGDRGIFKDVFVSLGPNLPTYESEEDASRDVIDH